MTTHVSESATPALTAAGKQRLEERLDRTVTEIAELDRLIKAGDAGDDQVTARRLLDEQAAEMQRLLSRAVDIGSIAEDPAIVEVGDEVDVQFADGDAATYAIVHAAEVSVGENRISAVSPLGQALLGRHVGDRVQVDAPAGAYSGTVVARRRLV